jgi:monoamine oxidase
MMAEELPDGVVHLNEPVMSVNHSSTDVTVTTLQLLPNGQTEVRNIVSSPSLILFQLHTYTARRLVIAIPPQQIAGVTFMPPLPDHKQALFASFPTGNLIKFIATYRRPFWRENGFSGEIVSTGLAMLADEVGQGKRELL